MKLSDWAKKNGLSYRTAHRLWKSGKLPCRAEQIETGTILVYEYEKKPMKIVTYSRVSSNDQKDDLRRQTQRLKDFCFARGWKIYDSVEEIGSGLNGKRKKLLKILSDKTITHIVIEHKDRLARFGVEMVESSLESSDRTIVIIDNTEYKDDLVQDFVDVVTSMCAKIYGKRSAKNRAKRAVEAISEDQA